MERVHERVNINRRCCPKPLIIGLVVLALVVCIGWFGVNAIRGVARQVKTYWSGDRLVLSNLSGRILVTHLAGRSGQTMVAAKLPQPVFILDSEGAGWTYDEVRKLKWFNEGGGEEPPPVAGSRIEALFVRLETTQAE